MIKIFMSVRNRLAITKHAIYALQKHTKGEYQLYVYNNNTTHLIDEHWEYFKELYKNKQVAQVCFTTESSTFNAFSKASTCNFFGLQHKQDPQKMNYDFVVMMDNDMIVTPDWDVRANLVWNNLKENKEQHIFVVSQIPGGIKEKKRSLKINGIEAAGVGKLGGSGFWIVQPNFWDVVGFLPLDKLVNQHKRHDQLYWQLLNKVSKGNPYIVGVLPKFAFHCGPVSGSVCNILTKNQKEKNKTEFIKFEKQEAVLSKMTFKEFWKWLHKHNPIVINGW